MVGGGDGLGREWGWGRGQGQSQGLGSGSGSGSGSGRDTERALNEGFCKNHLRPFHVCFEEKRKKKGKIAKKRSCYNSQGIGGVFDLAQQ